MQFAKGNINRRSNLKHLTSFTFFEWDDVDDIAIVLGVFNEKDELLASLRGEIIKNRADAENKLHYTLPTNKDLFSGIVLGRGVTLQSQRKKIIIHFCNTTF